MRIDAKDRRNILRRMRFQLPQIMRNFGKRGKESFLVLMVTFFITPETLAQIATKSVEPVFTKTYKKEELNFHAPANPNGGRAIDNILKDHLTALAQRVTQQQSGGNRKLIEYQAGQAELTKEQWSMQLDGVRESTERKLDGDGLREFMLGQTQKALGDHAKDNVSFYQRFKSGMSLKFNIGEFFGVKKHNQEFANVPQGKIRYGLLVKDIIPANDAVAMASLGGSEEEEMRYAGHADVHWTIGPLEEEAGRKVFNFSETIESPPNADSHVTIASMMERIKLPSTTFGMRVEPGNADQQFTNVSGGMPIKTTIEQEQGLYRLTYMASSSAGSKGQMAHEMRVPIAGDMSLGRRFDEKFNVVQTSAYNILMDKRFPVISVHYMNLEDRYRAEAGFERKFGRVTMEAGYHTNGMKAADLPEVQRDNIKLNYGKDL